MDFVGSIARGDVLGTIPIERYNLDEKQSFHKALNIRFSKLLDKFRMFPGVLDSGVAKDLKPRALGIIHKEKRNAIVGGEIAGRKHLAIATVIGKRQRSWIQYSQKAWTAATMLHVRPAVFIDCRNVKAVARLNEGELLFGQSISLRRPRESLCRSKIFPLRFAHRIRHSVF